jgi:hypothetical protein
MYELNWHTKMIVALTFGTTPGSSSVPVRRCVFPDPFYKKHACAIVAYN